uniref:Uncharacterized protein n=1 Tax=Romanomermis culicivorax TaxID=13658 RepID=A0A915K7Y9_ROMCU
MVTSVVGHPGWRWSSRATGQYRGRCDHLVPTRAEQKYPWID